MFIALALNFDLFSDTSAKQIRPKQSIEEIKKRTSTPIENTIIETNTFTMVKESNLSKELQELLTKAQKLFRDKKDAEVILLYEEVISKSKNSKEIKILKLFAQACLKKATVHYIYPNHDIEAAIESYELILNNFKNKYNKELLLTYMKAKLKQAQFTSKEETLIAYDVLIEKFQNDKEKRFEKEIEDLLFSKSFALMGRNDEEAIEVLDKIIAKYSNKSNLPDTVKFSILNNIELSIITSNDTDKYVDLANQYMADSPDTKPLLGMLNIIKNAEELDQTEALAQWKEEHDNYVFPDWDFSELRKWVNKMERPQSQKRIRNYLDLFEKQKYKNIYQVPAATVPTHTNIYADESTQNTYPDPYASVEDEDTEIIYDDVPIYEPDPYLNDIYPNINASAIER